MRHTETVKVPTYKWVLEDVCCECAANCDCSENVPADANTGASELPKPNAK
jgi:hypothetical protein